MYFLQKISSPVVVSERLCRAASSSDTSKSELTTRIKISSCAVSCTSLLSSIANAKHLKSLAFSFSWTCTLCPISSIRLVTVDADRLTALRESFLSRHTPSATAFKHFLTNSPSLNDFPQLAISLAILTWPEQMTGSSAGQQIHFLAGPPFLSSLRPAS